MFRCQSVVYVYLIRSMASLLLVPHIIPILPAMVGFQLRHGVSAAGEHGHFTSFPVSSLILLHWFVTFTSDLKKKVKNGSLFRAGSSSRLSRF
jgi:hypothetical protein